MSGLHISRVPCDNCGGKKTIEQVREHNSPRITVPCPSCEDGMRWDLTGTFVFDTIQRRFGTDAWRDEPLVSVVDAVLDALMEKQA